MKYRLLKVGTLFALLGSLTFVERSQAQGTDTLFACFDRAADSFVACVDGHAWYVAPLCELRFNADALLCAGKQFMSAAT